MSPQFGLIIIGDEILSGKRADKHLPKTIELLAERGLQLDYAEYVGDSPDRITAALKRAFASGDIVFSTGGIGATPDDHTRQCAAQALGVDLVLHPRAESLIRERMQDTAKEQGTTYEPDRPDNIHRLNMGVFPVSSTNPRLAGLIANTFMDNTLGVLFSGAYSKRDSIVDRYNRNVGQFEYTYRNSQHAGITPNTFGFARPTGFVGTNAGGVGNCANVAPSAAIVGCG